MQSSTSRLFEGCDRICTGMAYVRNSQRIHDLRIFRHDVSCVLALLYCDSEDEYIGKLTEMWREMDIPTIWNTVFEFPEHSVETSSSSTYDERQEAQKKSYRSYDRKYRNSIDTLSIVPPLPHHVIRSIHHPIANRTMTMINYVLCIPLRDFSVVENEDWDWQERL